MAERDIENPYRAVKTLTKLKHGSTQFTISGTWAEDTSGIGRMSYEFNGLSYLIDSTMYSSTDVTLGSSSNPFTAHITASGKSFRADITATSLCNEGSYNLIFKLKSTKHDHWFSDDVWYILTVIVQINVSYERGTIIYSAAGYTHNGGDSVTVPIGDSVQLPVPIRDGTGELFYSPYTSVTYVDPVWRDTSNIIYKAGSHYKVTQPTVTLTAETTRAQGYGYVVVFNPDGGTNAPSTLRYPSTDSSASIPIPDTIPKKEGYRFAGWRYSANEMVSAGGSIVLSYGQTVLTAVWVNPSILATNVMGVWMTDTDLFVKVGQQWRHHNGIFVNVSGVWMKIR